MTDDRKRLLDLLAELSTMDPDMRMGRRMLMFSELARGSTPKAI
jgi:hypothetical protein